MDRHMEDKSQQESGHCITIESNKTDDDGHDNRGYNGQTDLIDPIGQFDRSEDQTMNKVVVISVKVMLIGMSAVYLCFEGIQLIRLYNNYDTVATVHYDTSDIIVIPSLTVCLPTIIDKNKLLAQYPDLGEKLNQTETESKRWTVLTEYLDKALESETWTRLTIEEEQALNCILNFWSIKSNQHSVPIGRRTAEKCREVVKPIESYSNAKTKCFTYFSKLSDEQPFPGMSKND